MKVRLRQSAVACGLALSLGACSNFSDALIINSCGEPVTVRVTTMGSAPSNPDEWDAVVELAPEDVKRVADIFQSARSGNYTAQFEFAGGSPVTIAIPARRDDPIPVLIAADNCPKTM